MTISFKELIAKVLALFRGRELDQELDQELQSHLTMLAEEHRRRGLTLEEAQRQARLELSGLTQLREAHRDARGLPLVESFVLDMRYALRTLRKSPGFVLTAITVLALGTGANTAVFSVVRAVLLRPLPFRDPGQVMLLYEQIPKRGGTRSNLSAANFFDLRQQNRSFAGMALMSGRGFAVTGGTSHEQVPGAFESSSFFSVLCVPPAR